MDQYLLEHFTRLLSVDVFCCDDEVGVLETFQDHHEHNPIFNSKELRHLLMENAKQNDCPFIGKWEFQIYFACIFYEQRYYMMGPMNIGSLGRLELHQYYKKYDVDTTLEKNLKRFTFSNMLNIVQVIAKLITGQVVTEEELIQRNQLVKSTIQQEEREQIVFRMKAEEEEIYHHTYQEEQKLLECIKTGNVEAAVSMSQNMDSELGKLSSKESSHWKNVAVVAITVCTRAAIESGVPPFVAYQISDFYIQKSDETTDIPTIIGYRNHAVEELTKRVYQMINGHRSSSYTEQCKDYVRKHYKEKIYQEDIANTLGVSSCYLSRLFKKETGECLQDYIVKVRVDCAANMLRYSDESIPKIAEYVHFPSQSYFGKMFKKYKNMTPRQYREAYQSTEY